MDLTGLTNLTDFFFVLGPGGARGFKTAKNLTDLTDLADFFFVLIQG